MFKIILGVIVFLLGPLVGMELITQLLGVGLVAWGIIGVVKTGVVKGAIAESSVQPFGEGYKYSFKSGKTAIAISPELKLVKLKEKSKVKEYGFDMIRSWESNNQTGGNVVNLGDISQSIANRNASGLFVYTKDLENVTWRVEMFNTKEQAKWMEIMRQCINEN